MIRDVIYDEICEEIYDLIHDITCDVIYGVSEVTNYIIYDVPCYVTYDVIMKNNVKRVWNVMCDVLSNPLCNPHYNM